ncbi:hypothetical protein [Stenotrophomonas rhizophila]|uniref:hypothetical protein n=1 Tax=Stenotrophomonas rhizophila TaxID=216778 RepID=UPI001AEC09E8|nr:hypothetical protein [Stenotrophomonas rhizophila]
MKLPNTKDVAEMLVRFEMAVEESGDGLRVFWPASGKEFGCFTGPGAFLDCWGKRAADGLYESKKLDFVCQAYLHSCAEGKAELLSQLRDHLLDDDAKLNLRMEEVKWVAPEDLGTDWVSRYAEALAGPYWRASFDLGILNSLMALDPSLESWVEEIRQEVRQRLGLRGG